MLNLPIMFLDLIFFHIKISEMLKFNSQLEQILFVEFQVELSNFWICFILKISSMRKPVMISSMIWEQNARNLDPLTKLLFQDLTLLVDTRHLQLEKLLWNSCILFMRKKRDIIFQEEFITKELLLHRFILKRSSTRSSI